jgi:hypothetical protein
MDREMTDLEKKLALALHQIANIHIGVYPKAVNNVPRTERQTGWNKARAAFAKEIHAVIRNGDPSVSIAVDIMESLDPLPPDEVRVKILDTGKEIE